jgi:hypothetical protein
VIAWLSKIWCTLTNIPCYVETALVYFVDVILAAIGAFLLGVLSLLPDMPALPTTPDAVTTAASWVAWFFPVSTAATIFGFLFSAWLLWQVVAVALRWAKAI